MFSQLQISSLFEQFDNLHQIHGDKSLNSIYGAGQINSPDICLIFMNPTATNVAAKTSWRGLRAPWLGTKNVWRLLNKLKLFNNLELLNQINSMKPEEWSEEFCLILYEEIAKQSIYITNIAKCTQIDARHLADSVYREYLPLMRTELAAIKPKAIIALGNQVSSVLLQKPISVSKYAEDEFEFLKMSDDLSLKVYPTYYPVGQGMRNMLKSISRINRVLEINRSNK